MPLLAVEHLAKRFLIQKGVFGRAKKVLHAVNDVNFQLEQGEALGLVGESGSGKSTTGRVILRLLEPTSGKITFDGVDVMALKGQALQDFRRNIQMVFQDPYASLNPRMTAGEILEEPMIYHGISSKKERRASALQLMHEVGLDESQYNRYPFQFSGGQRQRIGIARALTLGPKLLIADEPVSALDVSVQAQVLNLFMDLQQKHQLTYILIAHDLGVVRHLCNRIAVMYLGEIVESAPTETLFNQPLHPYTQALLNAIPRAQPGPRRKRALLSGGDVPDPTDPPEGCRYHPRCPHAMALCKSVPPPQVQSGSHTVSCHLHGQAFRQNQ